MSHSVLACVAESCPTRRGGVVTVRPVSRTTRAVTIAATAIAVLFGGLVPATTASATDTATSVEAKRKAGPSAKSAKGKVRRNANGEIIATCSPETATPNAFSRARYVWTQLRNAGYSPAASAGVVGVLDYRSALAPMAIAADWWGFGIAQWPGNRWKSYVDWVEADGFNRWSPKRQVMWLVQEMATNPETFDSENFKGQTDASQAARVFRQTYYLTPADEPAVSAMGSRARQWLDQLRDLPLIELNPALTNGIQVPCEPASGALLDRCPMVPDSFKRSFASFTGFSWDRLDGNTQMMSRCVYTNFPYIQSQGTYNGHSPDWSQAIDFFMPSGCTYRDGRAVTSSSVDLAVGKRLARYLIVNAGKIGLDYIIFQDHIRNPDEHTGERYWRRVSMWRKDNYNNGDCVNTHYDHVHASTYSSGGWAASVPQPALNPDGLPW